MLGYRAMSLAQPSPQEFGNDPRDLDQRPKRRVGAGDPPAIGRDRSTRPTWRASLCVREGGVMFDARPTVITDPACLTEIWGLSGQVIERDFGLPRIRLPERTSFS